MRDQAHETPIKDLPDDLPGRTFGALLTDATERAAVYRSMCDQDMGNQRAAARDFSLAITQLELARFHFTNGYARLSGGFNPADLESVDLSVLAEQASESKASAES